MVNRCHRIATHVRALRARGIATPVPNAELRVIPGAPGTAWEQLALPKATKQDQLDVFFAPGYTAPLLLNTPTVVLVHDISFAAHPEWFRWKEGLRRRLLTRWSSHHAALVLTVSEGARREIISHFGLSEHRVRCIYPGVISLDGGSKEQDPPYVSSDPIVLFVGLGLQPSPPSRSHSRVQADREKPCWRAPRDRRRQSDASARGSHGDRGDGGNRLTGVDSAVRASTLSSPSCTGGRARSRCCRIRRVRPSTARGARFERAVSARRHRHRAGSVRRRGAVCGKGDIAGTTAALNSLLFDEEVRQRVLDAGPAVLARYSWTRAGAETLAALESVG